MFPYRITVTWSDEDECFIARVPAFANCAAHGDTEDKAIEEVKAVALVFREILRGKAPASDIETPQ